MAHRPTANLAFPLLLAFFFLSLYLLSGSSDLRHNGDTDLRYQTTQAIVDQHRLWIAHPLWTDTRVAIGRGGHLYAFYAPGQTVLMIPLYVAGKFIAHHLSLLYDVTTLYATRSLDLLLGAALAVLFYFMAVSIGYSARVAALLTLVFGLASVAWPDAQNALEQTQVNLFLLLAVLGAWKFVSAGMRRRTWLVLAGTAVGLALLTRYDALVYLLPIVLYPTVLRVVRRERREILGDWAVYALSLSPWMAALAMWNFARFGSPFLTGLHERTFGEPLWNGLLGLLVSPGKGIIWYLPLVVLLPWSMTRFYRRNRSLAVFLGVLVVVTLLFYSSVLYWHGDPAWGPRYLYVVVPYLVLPLGEILSSWRAHGRRLQTLALLVIAGSFLLQVAAISVTQWRFWYRLQAAEELTSQKFQWGAQQYHYYWNVRDSPIPIQIDNVYQVLRLNAGDGAYRLTAKPASLVHSNPAQDYPVNTLAFWWADERHPLLSQGTRSALALSLAATAGASLLLLLLQLRGRKDAGLARSLADLDLAAAGR